MNLSLIRKMVFRNIRTIKGEKEETNKKKERMRGKPEGNEVNGQERRMLCFSTCLNPLRSVGLNAPAV